MADMREPAQLQTLTHRTLQCTEDSPLIEYLAVINEGLGKICI